MKNIRIIFSMLVLTLTITIITPCAAFAAVNLADNPGFEEHPGRSGWSEYIWDKSEGLSQITVDNTVTHSGNTSICIINNGPNDSRILQKIAVSGNRYYRLSCWIKAENVGTDAKGANLSIEGLLTTSMDLKPTADWEQAEIYGRTKSGQTSFVLTLGVGGYSSLNSGKAWFDDVAVEEVESVPAGSEVVDLFREESVSGTSGNTGNTSKDASTGARSDIGTSTIADDYNTSMLLYFIAFILIFAFLSYYNTRRNRNISKRNERILLLVILSTALLVRVFLAQVIEGWPNDIYTNKSWAAVAAKGLSTFYSSIWCDYPPLLIYILAIVGKLASIPALAPHFTLLIKLPAILADIATAFLLYKVAARQLKPILALTAAAAYAFHPAVFLDSTVWGQVDSIFTLIVIAALILLVDRKLNASAVLLTLATLMKPQGIFFLPVMLFELIKRKKASNFVWVILCGLATAIIVILPFAFNQEPLWIFKLYLSTGKEYPSAAMNPFNVFTMAGGNFVDGAARVYLFSYNTWGILFDVIILVLAGYIHLKSRHVAVPIAAAALLNAGAFIFSVKMHERYLFPILAILLLAILYLKDKKFILLFAGFSATVFFNIHILFYRMLQLGVTDSYFSGKSLYVILFSLMNVLLFIYLVKVSHEVLIGTISGKAAQNKRNGVHGK